MWTAIKKNKDKCEGCDHLTTFPVACVTCQNLILEQSPQAGSEAVSVELALLSDRGVAELLKGILPEMEARVRGLTELWPGRDTLCVLHRNEAIVYRIKQHLGT